MVKTKRTVLILGGTGAMGNFLVDIFLNSNEWDVYVTSRSHHSSVLDNLTYFIGNAKDLNFIKEICTTKYDAIVDFMNYDYDEFLQNCNFLLNSCKHYIFLSSCRVYNNGSKLTEESDRLLDTIADKEFLSTQRYALRKARQEDILKSCDNKNWTIVRPYITYSNIRLQLGVYEKEEWLYRILNNKKLVIRKEILDCYTTLTYGFDVASGIYQIVNNNSLMEDTIQIVTEESITWREILEIYKKVLKEKLNIAPVIIESSDLKEIEELFEGGYNTKYDRLWHRTFDNSKAKKFCQDIKYLDVKTGLEKSLSEFIDAWKINGNSVFYNINDEFQTKMDLLCDKY